jgi:GNAT superfamily N-acetyltransferase
VTSLSLHKLSSGSLWRIAAIQRDPAATGWAIDVERILLDGLAVSHLGEPGSALLAADDEGRIVGAALHYEHEELVGVQYVAAVLIDHRFRRRGLGRELFDLVLDDARTRSGRPYVAWAVHPGNVAMLALSVEIVATFSTDDETGYVHFVHP